MCDEHEKARSGLGAPAPSPGRAPCRVPRAGTRTQARNTSQMPGLGRRFSWSRRKAGLHGRVSILGQRKGSRAWHPLPCASALTVPSPSPSPATLTPNVAPCGLSSSVRCERRVVGTGPVEAPSILSALPPPYVLGIWERSVLAVASPGVRPL